MDLADAMDDLGAECRERFEAGGAVAAREGEALLSLAGMLAAHVRQWESLAGGLELCGRFDRRRAGALLLESVFDDLLPAAPWRVLAAALAENLAGP
ncbi:MAG TPA: hypothetical protein VG166_08550 [Caulobacteraceae bacterium]|nr:hypothetical protein [Caulobacteraceae bacterium]